MTIADYAETYVRDLADAMVQPHPGECLCCYVWRMLEDCPCRFGTQPHFHALLYGKLMAPRATALRRRLSDMGACCDDVELFLNAYEPVKGLWILERDGDGEVIDAAPPDTLPDCVGVRRGSTRPCTLWTRIRRW